MRQHFLFSAVAMVLTLCAIYPVRAAVKLQIFLKDNISTVPDYECLIQDQDLPKVNIQKGTLTVETQSVRFEATQLTQIGIVEFVTYDSNILVGMEDKMSPVTCLRFSYLDNQTIDIQGLEVNDPPRLYAIDGLLVPAKVNYAGNRAQLSLRGLPVGIYLIQTRKQTFKIYKK